MTPAPSKRSSDLRHNVERATANYLTAQVDR